MKPTIPAPASPVTTVLATPPLPTIDLTTEGVQAMPEPRPIDFAARYEADMIATYGSFREDPRMAVERELARRDRELASAGHSYLWRTGYDSREEHLADILRDIEGGR